MRYNIQIGQKPPRADRARGHAWLRLVPVILLTACAPAAITRIGPSLTPRKADCEVEVLPPGQKPIHPYRDVGMVSLQNCQEYHVNPCRAWLTKAVCETGGQVAYLPEPTPPKNELGAVNYRVMVAVYLLNEPEREEGVCKEPASSDGEIEPCEE